MKCLSLSQPWGWAIFHGKDVENRKWPTKFRGSLLIQASLSWDEDGYQWLIKRQKLIKHKIPKKGEFPKGCILGQVDVVDCVKSHKSFWFFGPYGFVLANKKAFQPPFIPCKGKLGLFNFDVEAARANETVLTYRVLEDENSGGGWK